MTIAPTEQPQTTWKYAQIETVTGKCVTVSFLSGEVIADHMILLDAAQEVNPRDIYDRVAGTWTAAPPIVIPPPQPTEEQIKIASLEQQMAQTNTDLATLQEMILFPQ